MNRLDERWDRLAAGGLSEAEHDELRGLADATAEGYEAYQAFKPLGAAFQRNAAAAILAQREREEDAKAEEEAAAAAASKKTDPAAPPKAPERKELFKFAAGLAAGTALAAGLLLFIPPRGIDSAGKIFVGGSRPVAESRGGQPPQPTGKATEIPRLVFGGMFEFKREAPAAGIEEKLYLQQGGKLERLALEFNSENLLDIPSNLQLEPGPAKLVYLVFRRRHEPAKGQILEEIRNPRKNPDRPWQVELRDVELARL